MSNSTSTNKTPSSHPQQPTTSPATNNTMAVMDLIEKESKVTAAVASDTGKDNVKQESPGFDPKSAEVQRAPGLSSNLAAAPNGGLKKKSPYLGIGPSPEKGSGQDRFRQMMNGAKPFVSTRYEDLDAPSPVKPGDLALAKLAELGQHRPYGMSSSAGAFNPPTVVGPTYNSNGGMGASHYSPYHDNTMGQARDFDPRAAINPSMPPPPYRVESSRGSSVPPVNNSVSKSNGSNVMKGGNNGGSRSGNGGRSTSSLYGGGGADWKPTWTSILSSECQKRRFNPQFTEWITQDGHYKASVNINGQILHDTRHFKQASDAKQALAKKAIDYVRTLPVGSQLNRASEKAKIEQQKMEQLQQQKNMSGGRNGQAPVKVEAGWDRYAGCSTNRPDPVRDYHAGSANTSDINSDEQDRRLLERIQSMYGRTPATERILADPVASRAFLEGFALGGRLRETARRQDGERERRRSRSPKYERHDAVKRERSPHSPYTPNRRHRERSPRRRASADEFPKYSD